MCELHDKSGRTNGKIIPVNDAIGTVLAHDITEITPGTFKGRAFRKGHVIRQEDICHLRRLGKENLFVLDLADDEMHEDEAAHALAHALSGEGVRPGSEPKEGKINLLAGRTGLLKINREALRKFNMLGDVICATLHDNTVVREGQIVAGTRAIPLVVKKSMVAQAVEIARNGQRANGESQAVVEVREIRKPKAGVVITGNEVYYGRIKDAFAPVIQRKIAEYGGEINGISYAPDDAPSIAARLRELINAGCDLLITTGGMSVDPDDVTRFAIRNLGTRDLFYGSPVLPGSMFLVAYLEKVARDQGAEVPSERNGHAREPLNPGTLEPLIPILGIPACGIYSKTTVFDLLLPRILAGDIITREEIAELGHGGLCLNCNECRYPLCPFGK
jgi:hypothetical protein